MTHNTRFEKIWIITADDPMFYGRLYCNLMRAYPDRIAGVIELPHPYARNLRLLVREIWRCYNFYGFAGLLHGMVQSALGKVSGRGNLRRTVKKLGIPYFTARNMKGVRAILETQDRPVTILASVVAKISKQTLDIAENGWINSHCGHLPEYGGMDAPFWSLYNNDPEQYICLHYMNEEYDKGSIIEQRAVKNEGLPYFKQVRRLFNAAEAMHMHYLANGYPPMATLPEQEEAGAHALYPRPEPDLGKKFRKAGGRFI